MILITLPFRMRHGSISVRLAMLTGPLFSCTAAAFVAAALAGPPSPPPASSAAAKPALATPAPAGADAWASKVQKAYEGVKDLSARFEQVTRFKGASADGPVSTGTVEVKKPGKMRWEFATPDAKSFVSDGRTLWMYEAEENQVVVNEFMQETTSVTALNFLEGLGDLKRSFTVSLAGTPAIATVTDAVFLELIPKDPGDVQFTRIVLAVNKKTALADEVYLTDPLGSQTRLTFRQIALNQSLPDARFTFDIPEGAEVIRPGLLR